MGLLGVEATDSGLFTIGSGILLSVASDVVVAFESLTDGETASLIDGETKSLTEGETKSLTNGEIGVPLCPSLAKFSFYGCKYANVKWRV